MRLDLHCHSTCSDGSLAPAEVARAALAGGARLFCLTDHDTLQGGPAVAEALAGAPCAVLRGLELSCNEGGRTIHLLIYGVGEGPGMDALAERLNVYHSPLVDHLLQTILDQVERGEYEIRTRPAHNVIDNRR